MGQQKLIKLSQTTPTQIHCDQNIPSILSTLGFMLNNQKLIITSPKEVSIGQGQNSFKIVADREIQDVNLFVGFIQIFNRNEKKIFQGTVKKFKREGFGIQYDEDSKIYYRGYFSDNVYNGMGQTSKYKGQFKDGHKDGWGIWNDLGNNLYYQGLFKQGYFNGIGYLNIRKTDLQYFLKQETPLGQKDTSINKYVGQWQNGYMHGKGKLITYNEIYKGMFEQGLPHGQGQLHFQNKTYEGQFYKNQYVINKK